MNKQDKIHYCITMYNGVNCICGKTGTPGSIKFTSHKERVTCEVCKRRLANDSM